MICIHDSVQNDGIITEVGFAKYDKTRKTLLLQQKNELVSVRLETNKLIMPYDKQYNATTPKKNSVVHSKQLAKTRFQFRIVYAEIRNSDVR